MKSYLVSKLTLRDILEVRPEIYNDTKPMKIEDVPWCTLRKIMALDNRARNTLLNTDLSGLDRDEEDALFDIDKHEDTQNVSSIHPLDVLCVLLHCSDNFLQQEIVTKMAMCQFSVPLLLPPEGDGSPCMFMLWAMRDIVKKWRPQCLADSKGFREENVVNISMPIISFVRLGKTKLSKSKILNQILNSSQQQYNFFIHDNVDGGNIERKISDGLVEMSWYFPSKKSDIFPEPFAVINLRGSLETNWDQFTFLEEVSSAVFIFIETIDEREFQLLSKCSQSDTIFGMVFTPDSGKHIEKETQKLLGDLLPVLRIDRENVILKKRTENDVMLTKKIQGRMKQILESTSKSISLKDLPGYFRGHPFVTDESTNECQKGKDHANKITREIKDVAEYKQATMKLQGHLWKQLSEIDKELCRMKNQGEQNAEMHKSHLLLQRNALHVKQYQQKISKGIGLFIQALTDLSPKERQYFLKWMKFNLDAIARDNLSKLQAIYKEKCDNLPHSKKELRDLGQKISDSCLGVEHFLREMGQFYEAEWSTAKHTVIQQNKKKFADLPRIAANFLLDGFPLELIDGDASNIPLQWITDVLTELDKRTGGQCRLRVITVLGVQSTGKSTLLNTMFGLQFPVASGRCTRGAFMTLLNVKKDFQEKLGCHFLLVIDTEGLKASELSSLEGSYEHDNELATLVVGLSDITIVNMAMENSTEMKDILQIVVHAFLRMKDIGKQPNCQFVHQNVSDVSAPDKNMRVRNKLLEQLNEMTKVAAKMEKKNQISAFTDVMKYDLNKDNWYILGLWQGDPPMAPVNLGYSSNVLQLKMYLLEVIEHAKSINKPSSISDFITWIESLWLSVKHEKFIFSFRNSLVVKAYNKLSVQYSLWEWDFCKKIYNWVISTENYIRNQSGEIAEFNKHELQNILLEEEAKMIVFLEKYFENSENSNLIERHREEFKLSINSLRKKLERNAFSKCHEAVSIQKGKIKIQDIHRKSQKLIEGRITHLLQRYRENKREVSEREIQEEFELMWKKMLSDLQMEELERCNVDHSLLHLLKNDMSNKGPQINEALIKMNDLHQQHAKQGDRFYIDDKKHFDDSIKSVLSNLISKQEHVMKVGDLAASIIQTSDEYINDKMSSSDDYNEMYSKELLYKINKMLNDKDVKKLNFNKQFELDIKLFIFAKASQAFQKLHDKFIHENDPKLCLEKLKEQYLSGFIHGGKDKNLSIANRFCERCLKPAIMDYLFKHLGQKIVDEILGDPENITFSSRSCFQCTVLEELLEEMSFQKYVEYINSYESFVKQWISTHIINKYCISPPASETLQGHILTSINKKIKTVLKNERCLKSQTVSCFLENFCELLKEDLVMSQEEMKVITFHHTGNVEQFSSEIEHYLKEAQRQIQSEVRSIALSSVLYTVTVKPQDELFRKVVGCRKQCPFCKVPCEIGGENHKIHSASIHRPLGLRHYEKNEDKSLIVDICSTRVLANCSFRNVDTEWKSYPCKQYSTIYPNWIIQPDASIESSDYWKYVFVQFNKNFAELYEAKPAELPEVWRQITKEQALHSLKKEFNISRSSSTGYPQPLSNIDPSDQYRSGHPSTPSPTHAQREPYNKGNFSKQSFQGQKPKVLNVSDEETSVQTKPTIAVYSISEEGHILWLRRLLSSDIFGHQHVTFHSISLDDKGGLRAVEFQCKVAVLYHTMQSGQFPTTPHGESLYHKVLQQMSEKLGRGNVVMIIDDVQAKEMLWIKKICIDIERLAEDLCPISHKDKEDEMKLVQKLKTVQQFRHMSEHPHKEDRAPQTSKTLNTCSQKTPTSQGSIIGIFSVSEEGHIDWLRRLMSSDIFGQREVTYHKMPSYDNVGLEEGKLQCGVAILYHTMKTGKFVTSQGEFLYHKVTDQLVQKLGKDNVIVLIDDLQSYTDKKWAKWVQSSIEKWAGDLLYFLQEEKHNRMLLVQRLNSLKLFRQPPDYRPNANPVQPAPGTLNTISAPASSVIGVFSCSENSKFSWLKILLSSKEFGNHQVIFHQISPGNMKGFHSMVSHCKFGILYHCMDQGYKPLTDMENSLYDEELKYLSTTLGKSRVIVVMDKLGNSDEEAKCWTLENQPSLGMLARDVLLFSKQENTHQEKPNRSMHVDRNLGMFYEKLNTLKEILKE
ncbi:interferon-induced very large GTPase 1-like [Aquarana catesbeiana]|uniref:interferon-induced very large GTPase 1-like n=1 Tax=Aquarana catesbeiana TaxID=8400 RepID=UPI003CC9272B